MTYTQELEKALEITRVLEVKGLKLPPAYWIEAWAKVQEAARLYLEQLR